MEFIQTEDIRIFIGHLLLQRQKGQISDVIFQVVGRIPQDHLIDFSQLPCPP